MFDCETTGVRPAQICQLAYLLVWPGGAEGRNYFFTVDAMDPYAQNIHKLSRARLERLSRGRRFRDDAPAILADFEAAHRVAGHNVDYDVHHLALEFGRQGAIWRPKSAVCTMNFFRQSVGAVDRKGKPKAPKLSELCAFFGVSTQEIQAASEKCFGVGGQAHDARYDVMATWLCLDAAQKMGQIRGLMR